jgi:XTP/dITP diphosphohydrolase
MSRRLVIASRNQHKVDELTAMIARGKLATALEVVSVAALPEYGPPPEVDETATTFSGNAVLKADAIAGWLRMHEAPRDDLVLADDSGLCVDAFNGQPGVYSARFAGPDATDDDNNAKLVAELEVRGLDSSPAEYVCVLALRNVGPRMFEFTLPDAGALYIVGHCLCIEGSCRGVVRAERRGGGGFGYDPHFWIDGHSASGSAGAGGGGAMGRTFAELSPGEKSQRSHRGMAMRRLVQELPIIMK